MQHRAHTESSSPYTNNPQQTAFGYRQIHSEQAHQHQALTSQQLSGVFYQGTAEHFSQVEYYQASALW